MVMMMMVVKMNKMAMRIKTMIKPDNAMLSPPSLGVIVLGDKRSLE